MKPQFIIVAIWSILLCLLPGTSNAEIGVIKSDRDSYEGYILSIARKNRVAKPLGTIKKSVEAQPEIRTTIAHKGDKFEYKFDGNIYTITLEKQVIYGPVEAPKLEKLQRADIAPPLVVQTLPVEIGTTEPTLTEPEILKSKTSPTVSTRAIEITMSPQKPPSPSKISAIQIVKPTPKTLTKPSYHPPARDHAYQQHGSVTYLMTWAGIITSLIGSAIGWYTKPWKNLCIEWAQKVSSE